MDKILLRLTINEAIYDERFYFYAPNFDSKKLSGHVGFGPASLSVRACVTLPLGREILKLYMRNKDGKRVVFFFFCYLSFESYNP